MTSFLELAFILAFVQICSSLSGSTIASMCHCDLTASFCDFSCCCDLDCSSTISTDCINRFSDSYCPDSTFWARMGSGTKTSTGCYYYNASSTITQQISLESPQVKTIVMKNQPAFAIDSTIGSVYSGYKNGDLLQIGSNTSFKLIDTTGTCLSSSTAASVPTFSLKFGINFNVVCSCPGCSTSIPLFTQFMGKAVAQYSQDTSSNVTIPSVSDSAMTSLQLTFVVGTYGSQQFKYIQRVTASYGTSGGNERSLKISFVQQSQILQKGSAATFFPQIPPDMFYPIYLTA